MFLLKADSLNLPCQKPAHPYCSQALILPSLAQNNTVADFTAAAVEMCGSGFLSESRVMSAAKEPLTRGQLRNPGTEVALRGGDLRAL